MNRKSPERRLDALVEEGIRDELFTGACYAVWQQGHGLPAAGCFGSLDLTDSPAVDSKTIWDLASLTKPLSTACILLLLAEDGLLCLDDSLSRFLDAPGSLARISLRDCLTHTSGLRPWERLFALPGGRAEIMNAVRRLEPDRAPGTGYAYSDLGYILLGQVIEQVTDLPLQESFRSRIAVPLGLQDTGFNPAANSRGRCAATFCRERDLPLRGEVHDYNCAALGGAAGHAGLFGTLDDLLRFGRSLLGDPALPALLAPLSRRAMMQNQNPAGMNGHGLGWFMRPSGYLPAGDFLPADTAGHTGFTGTSMLLSPSLGSLVVLLTNRVRCPGDAPPFLRWRRPFHNAASLLLRTPA